jgi:hypothetical protein
MPWIVEFHDEFEPEFRAFDAINPAGARSAFTGSSSQKRTNGFRGIWIT